MHPNQLLWEKGDFTKIATAMRVSGDALITDLGIGKNDRVLDLGCGDGTTALPAALRGASVLGVDIARNLVAEGNRRAQELNLTNCSFQVGDAADLQNIDEDQFDWVVSIFGAMFAANPDNVAKEMVRTARKGGTIVMGNWIPNDPTLVAQILKICTVYAPPPPNSISPMLWGIENEVVARFKNAGISEQQIKFERRSYQFHYLASPAKFVDEFKTYYGPTINAFAAAEASGQADALHSQLVDLFVRQNTSTNPNRTAIAATYLLVKISV